MYHFESRLVEKLKGIELVCFGYVNKKGNFPRNGRGSFRTHHMEVLAAVQIKDGLITTKIINELISECEKARNSLTDAKPARKTKRGHKK